MLTTRDPMVEFAKSGTVIDDMQAAFAEQYVGVRLTPEDLENERGSPTFSTFIAQSVVRQEETPDTFADRPAGTP